MLFKIFLKFSLLMCFSVSVQAGLIKSEDLPASNPVVFTDYTAYDNYITYQDIDWAWASMIGTESAGLKLPDFHDGWDYVNAGEFAILQSLSLDYFTKKDAGGNIQFDANGNTLYIHAAEYWNDTFQNVTEYDNLNDLLSGSISWDAFVGSQPTGAMGQDTFYVRRTPTNNANPVPEPSTLAIFAIALIALARKARKSA